MKSNEDILYDLQQVTDCHWDYDAEGRKMFLEAMKQAQIEALRELHDRIGEYGSVINNLVKEIESQ